MKATVFCSYGVLAHEKRNFYSVFAPASDIFDKVEISVPDEIIIGKNKMDDIILLLDGVDYLLSEVITNAGDAPVIRWFNGKTYKTIKL